jgi:hypothetical protein
VTVSVTDGVRLGVDDVEGVIVGVTVSVTEGVGVGVRVEVVVGVIVGVGVGDCEEPGLELTLGVGVTETGIGGN